MPFNTAEGGALAGALTVHLAQDDIDRADDGDDVGHEKFGEGVIVDVIGEGDKAEAVVRFREVGEKRLLLAWAPLEKL